MSGQVLELRGVKKFFGSVSALEDMSFTAYAGEVHAIVGDNGAGKSTAIKIITGIYSADEGEIAVLGEALPQRKLSSRLRPSGANF